jgi:hypothetical protein
VLVDDLEEVNLGRGVKWPTYVSMKLPRGGGQKGRMCDVLKEFADCFTWDYTNMPGLEQDLVGHVLSIKQGFQPYKQPTRNFNLELLGKIKQEVERLLKARFMRTCRYTEWISNIVPVEKKNTGEIRLCVDFKNLNRATPKDEYPMPIADNLITLQPFRHFVTL